MGKNSNQEQADMALTQTEKLVDLINATSCPMQLTFMFTPAERKLVRQAAIDYKILMYRYQGVMWVDKLS